MTAPYINNNKKRIASAFSGGFGSINFALKYEDIEHEDVFAVEWKKPQRECYILNHGNPTDGIFEDICDFDGTPYKGEIDLYHLSPVCTSFSMAGKREGLDSAEGDLMFESICSIDEVQPKIFTVENVASLTSANNGEDWKEVLKAFRSLKGYTISWGKMNAKHYGGIQNRHRIFIVGFRANCIQMAFPRPIQREYKLADFLEDEVDEKYYLSQKMLDCFTRHKDRHDAKGNGFGMKPKTRKDEVASAINCKAGTRATCNYIKEDLKQVGNIDTKGHNSLWGRVYDPDGIAPTQNANGGGAGAKTGLFKIKSNTKDVAEIRTDEGIRRFKDGVCGSLRTTGSCGDKIVIEKSNIRRLTPREVARVQGDFEDKFKMDGFSDTKLYEFIGNAIEINTMRHIIKQVLKHADTLTWNEPQEPSFVRSSTVTQTILF